MMNRKKTGFLVFLLILSACTTPRVEAQEPSGSITFQPSVMPEIGFNYNPTEYTFDLTWKTWYITIKPFAIYDGTEYTLKQIVPWLKNNYPNIEYRHAIQKFKNYHRWGYWLEKLPQEVADKLDYLGFDMVDTNVPLDKFVIEEVEGEYEPFKRITIADRFSFDFYDLIERNFTFDIVGRRILIGNVRGKTNLDLDPITFAAPTMIVVGNSPDADPWNFWDLWNASNVNGWNVVNNTCNTQFKFWCKIVFGDDGSTPTSFTDVNKQVIFNASAFLSGSGEYIIRLRNNVNFSVGEVENVTIKSGRKGCVIFVLLSSAWWYSFQADLGSISYYYDSKIYGEQYGPLISVYDGNIWGTTLGGGAHISSIRNGDVFNVIVESSTTGIRRPINSNVDRLTSLSCNYAIWFQEDVVQTIRNLYARDYTYFRNEGVDVECFIINADVDSWTFNWLSNPTGEIYRQYSFDVVVVDKDGNALQNANVTLTYSGQGGGTIGSWATPSNGSIPEQTISKGFYNQTGGDTIYPYETYNLTIISTGYIPQTFIFNVSDPIDWTIPLVASEDGIINQSNWNILGLVTLVFVGLVIMTKIKR